MRAFALLSMLAALATPAHAEQRKVIGYAGVLGEWELTATVTETASRRSKEFAGPLTMKHTGVCTTDGPEEKTGEIRFVLTSSSRLNATLSFDGVACTYSGRLADFFTGTMACPDRPAVPLRLWVR